MVLLVRIRPITSSRYRSTARSGYLPFESLFWQANPFQDDAIDVLPIAFVDTFFGTGGYPEMNIANVSKIDFMSSLLGSMIVPYCVQTCNSTVNGYYSGTELLNCSFLASDIEYCQSQGKAVTISLGGAGGGVGFSNDSEAQSFADQIWNLFLGGSSDYRPFGSAVLDGLVHCIL